MKSLGIDAVANRVPYLRVYNGEETDGSQTNVQLVLDPPSHSVNEDVEAIWAGRTPAARLSARIAA